MNKVRNDSPLNTKQTNEGRSSFAAEDLVEEEQCGGAAAGGGEANGVVVGASGVTAVQPTDGYEFLPGEGLSSWQIDAAGAELSAEGGESQLTFFAGQAREKHKQPNVSRNKSKPRLWAQRFIEEQPAVPEDDPYLQHVADVRAKLQASGLPTSAEGARLVVLDSGEHAEMVTRAAAGPHALGRGADIAVFGRTSPLYAKIAEAFQRRNQGKLSAQQVVEQSGDWAVLAIEGKRRDLHKVREWLSPSDGQTTLVNMSYGISPEGIANEMAVLYRTAPEGSPLRQRAEEILQRERAARGAASTEGEGAAPKSFGQVMRALEADVAIIRRHLSGLVADELARPAVQARIAAAREELEQELVAARKEGILVLASAGNDYPKALDSGVPARSSHVSCGTKGLLTVGSTDLGQDAIDPADNLLAAHSSAGADLVAPGMRVPVGRRRTASPDGSRLQHVQGTSFAAPYVVGVAALMIAANPKLTPDDLEQILTSREVCRDLPETARDGVGEIDPVAAVKMARSWKHSAAPSGATHET